MRQPVHRAWILAAFGAFAPGCSDDVHTPIGLLVPEGAAFPWSASFERMEDPVVALVPFDVLVYRVEDGAAVAGVPVEIVARVAGLRDGRGQEPGGSEIGEALSTGPIGSPEQVSPEPTRAPNDAGEFPAEAATAARYVPRALGPAAPPSVHGGPGEGDGTRDEIGRQIVGVVDPASVTIADDGCDGCVWDVVSDLMVVPSRVSPSRTFTSDASGMVRSYVWVDAGSAEVGRGIDVTARARPVAAADGEPVFDPRGQGEPVVSATTQLQPR